MYTFNTYKPAFQFQQSIVNDESKLNQTKLPLSFQLHTNEAYDAILGRLPPISHKATALSHTSHSELSRESDHLSECCRLMFKKSFFFSSKKIYFYVSGLMYVSPGCIHKPEECQIPWN